MSEQSDSGRIVDAEFTGGKASQLVVASYVPPLDGTKDELDAFDMRIAKSVARELVTQYPGYPWSVTAESKQGIVYFSIPVLMGPTLKYIIRLGQFADLTPQLIRVCAGELLERLGLNRGGFDIAQYLAAKNAKHKFDFGDVRSK